MKKFKIDLEEKHGRQYLNGVRVRDTDTFTYWHKKKGWQEGFKSIDQAFKHMQKQSPKLIEKLIMVSLNERAGRGERVYFTDVNQSE